MKTNFKLLNRTGYRIFNIKFVFLMKQIIYHILEIYKFKEDEIQDH